MSLLKTGDWVRITGLRPRDLEGQVEEFRGSNVRVRIATDITLTVARVFVHAATRPQSGWGSPPAQKGGAK